MGKKKSQPKRKVVQELDLADHTTRLRSIPSGPAEALRQLLVWMAAAILLAALGWMALGR